MSFGVVEVADGAAIGYDNTVVSPLFAENMRQQAVAAAARFTLEAVVGTHHFFYLTFFYQCFKGRQVGFVQIARADVLRIEAVAVPFGTGVHGEVLGASVYLIVFPVFVQALQAFYNIYAHNACQIRVFTVCFYTPSPARVAVDVHRGCPDGQPLITFVAALFRVDGILGACFVGYGNESCM